MEESFWSQASLEEMTTDLFKSTEAEANLDQPDQQEVKKQLKEHILKSLASLEEVTTVLSQDKERSEAT